MTANRGQNGFDQSSQGARHGIKPWNKPMIESNGDYRDEMFLEEYIGGPLYENQKNMPRLPIPSIRDTMARFLPTALPLAKTEEEKIALKDACKTFPEQAQALHQRLIARRNSEMANSSWLQQWWNQVSPKMKRKNYAKDFLTKSHFGFTSLQGGYLQGKNL